ncbi:hypothetical protein CQW23_13823 [Capsicum baccatum]|uniref:Uncharacterized protein n=1 Tax=Capsicum baccatum TaxID=33114 RepID=A0A2G2WHE4_CAPBA|nr:hypothetical protein CQW23_13823 [Capsicum baccatum]
MEECKIVSTPMNQKEKLKRDDGAELVDEGAYRSLIGCLMYLTTTRPDILFPVSVLSRFLNCASELHMITAKRVVRYLKGTLAYGIKFSKSQNFKLCGYSDSDWGGSTGDMKSTSGYCFTFGSRCFSWCSKKQETIVQPTAEAKFIAATATVNQALWLRKVLIDLQLEQEESTAIVVDNQAAIAIYKDPCFMEGPSTSISNSNFLEKSWEFAAPDPGGDVMYVSGAVRNGSKDLCERAALMNFKSLLTDPSNRLSSWQGENCCSWKGIKCSSSGHVVVVSLRNPHPIEVMININKEVVSNSQSTSDFALKGNISPLLFTLDHMQHLDLSCNNFMFSKLPAEISNLTKLTYLKLSNAMFQDSIAMQFTNLTSLRSLDLSCANLVPDYSSVSVSLTFPLKLDFGSSLLSFISYGYLSSPNLSIPGRIPTAQFLNLTNIASLDMSSNVLKSSIPDLLSNITTLSVLDFSRNDLNGHIPYLPQLEELSVASNPAVTIDLVSMFAVPWSKLTLLDICFTRVGGTIPPSLSKSTSLTFFRADGCSIQGSIPSSITKLKKLSVLMLNENDITGQLPVSMSSLTTLQYLSLFQNRLEAFIQRNRLNGNTPFSLFRKSRLDEISLGTSGLSVEIDDPAFAQTFQPKILDFTSCNMRGEIPDFFSNFTSLVVLNFANNSLSGAIPQWLFNLPALSILALPMNNFKGFIPPMIHLKSSLFPTIVNLARNKLQGPIPTQLENVNVIDLSLNNFVGSIPSQVGEAPGIRSISLSGNKIRGSIPESFCHASNILQVLDLSNNSLSGTIQRYLGNYKSLIYLNLGQNKLTGSVPEELEHITSLRYLDLNGNQFEGSFPAVIENFQDLEILNLAGNRFEGKIPKFIGDLRSLRILVLESNSFNESIPEGLMNLENLQYIGLSRNNLSGPIPENLDGLKKMAKRQNEATILG